MSAATDLDALDFVSAADEFAARLCAHMASDGYSVLLLGESGSGKTTVAMLAEERIGRDLAGNIVEWNGIGIRNAPPTDRVCYVLLSRPVGVSLHFTLPEHGDGLDALVRRHVHPGWLRE